jgi:dihydroorotate dehydrogenase
MTVLATTPAGIPLRSCLMYASGLWSGAREKRRALAASATGAVGYAVALLRGHRIDVNVCKTRQLAVFLPAIGGALSRGAKAVQIGSALMKEGPGAFARIQQELTTERTAHETGT